MKKIIPFKSNSHLIKELQEIGVDPSQEEDVIKRVTQGEDIRLVNLDIFRKNYQSIKKAFPYAKVYAATKAISTSGMISMLKDLGAGFEVATLEELHKLMKLHVLPENIYFSHPDKDSIELKSGFAKKLRGFVSDSVGDLEILSRHVPGAKVLIRIISESNEPHCGIRFGSDRETTKHLIRVALKLKLKPVGLTFHVGTQTEEEGAWEGPIRVSGRIFKEMEKEGILLDTLNLGGGFPALLTKKMPSLPRYGKAIKSYLKKSFKSGFPKNVIIEPGRAISGTAGLTIGRVINAKHLSQNNTSDYIVTLSVGRFSAGLLGIGQKMIFYSRNKDGHLRPVQKRKHILGSVYGKACAPLDVVHMEEKVLIPQNLKSGDIVIFMGTGAYVDQMSAPWCSKKIPTDIIFDPQEQDQKTIHFRKKASVKF